MDRRTFLGTAAVATAGLAAQAPLAAAGLAAPKRKDKKNAVKPDEILVRFLGTGAADWNGPDDRGEHRRLSSVLVDNLFLIDFTATAKDMLPADVHPRTIFYTHSHGDHYSPKAALEIGIEQVYLSETILQKGIRDFRKASEELGLPMPVISTISPGSSVRMGDLIVTAIPSNHFVSFEEQTQMYLLEKNGVRLVYATDTGGIPCKAAQIVGIDAHSKGKPITGLIMEATMGIGYDDDFRLYTHSSVATVHQIYRVLHSTGRYTPPEGQPVYLTHMARGLHGTQAELDATLPAPLKAAYDGQEVAFKAV